ncbi:MAG: GntR family transcriptional regulator [Clostridiales bacterium]|nr:GntR family transcriptional regulator [Clostridiales bacterium]
MINLDYHSKKPIYEQIIEEIKLLVVKGHLSPGDSIPSVRKMAQTLNITPSTVAKAYQELERQKVIETIRAKGTFISDTPQIEPNEESLEKIRRKIQSEIIELKRMNYSEADVEALVKEIYHSI